jgi:hypothetical protein
MLPDRDYGRLAKTISLLDSPVEGERAAALEAVSRQLGTLGLRWADVAPKFGTLDGGRDRGAADAMYTATTERSILSRCSWGQCSEIELEGSSFCGSHVAEIVREPLDNFMTFLERLPHVVNAETACNALYHAVHAAVHIGMFNRYVGHDLMRAAGASRDGNGVAAIVEKLKATIDAREQGEFMMHLKRQLVVPERRSARRE